MRKVLGDRRIAVPWGGSVIDSIIGVYITQNVSDTFSSKAFMNIASKFPSSNASYHSKTFVHLTLCFRATTSDIVDWQMVLDAPEKDLSDCIECRGMHNVLARRIRFNQNPFYLSNIQF